MDYQLIRSNRKTISVQVTENGVIVRAPLYMPRSRILAFADSKKEWIEKAIVKTEAEKRRAQESGFLDEAAMADLCEKAKAYIPSRVAFYADLLNVTYKRISFRFQKTRWGSCSSEGNLSFNCLLMLMPREVADSVVVHELCHRKQMNHSSAFYREVLRVFPDYQKWHAWLSANGKSFINRINMKRK